MPTGNCAIPLVFNYYPFSEESPCFICLSNISPFCCFLFLLGCYISFLKKRMLIGIPISGIFCDFKVDWWESFCPSTKPETSSRIGMLPSSWLHSMHHVDFSSEHPLFFSTSLAMLVTILSLILWEKYVSILRHILFCVSSAPWDFGSSFQILPNETFQREHIDVLLEMQWGGRDEATI